MSQPLCQTGWCAATNKVRQHQLDERYTYQGNSAKSAKHGWCKDCRWEDISVLVLPIPRYGHENFDAKPKKHCPQTA